MFWKVLIWTHTIRKVTKKKYKILIVSLYIDDLIYIKNDRNTCDDCKNSMMLEFNMSDLGRIRYFLGVEVIQNLDGIFVLRKYAHEILARSKMDKSSLVQNPIVWKTKLTKDGTETKIDETLFKQVVGSLMYLTATWPNLMYGESLISRFMSCPTESHWIAAKRILRYVKKYFWFYIFN